MKGMPKPSTVFAVILKLVGTIYIFCTCDGLLCALGPTFDYGASSAGQVTNVADALLMEALMKGLLTHGVVTESAHAHSSYLSKQVQKAC